MNNSIKNWENLLKNDKKQSFLEKWEKQSQKFGKKTIFNLFQLAYDSCDSDPINEQFNERFDTIIIKALKQKKDIQFLNKKNYKEIMSLFGKFIHIMKNHKDDVLNTLWWNLNRKIKNNNIENISWNWWTQISLFDELSKIYPENTFQKPDIDLDILYARDPNELWWNR